MRDGQPGINRRGLREQRTDFFLRAALQLQNGGLQEKLQRFDLDVRALEQGKPALGENRGEPGFGVDALVDLRGRQRRVAERRAERIANDYSLREVSAWTIDALRLRCMLYELPVGTDREAALSRLRADRRVELAQALQEFETYSAPSPVPASVQAPPGDRAAYNDPYIGLQQGFSSIDAAAAQR
jgi:hypothetical protein